MTTDTLDVKETESYVAVRCKKNHSQRAGTLFVKRRKRKESREVIRKFILGYGIRSSQKTSKFEMKNAAQK